MGKGKGEVKYLVTGGDLTLGGRPEHESMSRPTLGLLTNLNEATERKLLSLHGHSAALYDVVALICVTIRPLVNTS